MSPQANQTARGRSTSRDPATPSAARSRTPYLSDSPSSTTTSQSQNHSHNPFVFGVLPISRSQSASRSAAASDQQHTSRARSLTRKPSHSNFRSLEPPKYEVAKMVAPGWFCVGVNPGNKDSTSGKVLSVHFWKQDDSEKMGGVAWKVKHDTIAATPSTRNLLLVPQPSHTPLGVSTSGLKLALLVLSRNHVPYGTPGKAKILQEKKDAIERALRKAIEATNAGGLPVAEQRLYFLRRALLLLVKEQVIQTHDTEGIWNLEPLYKEIEMLIDNLEPKGNHLQYAENSW